MSYDMQPVKPVPYGKRIPLDKTAALELWDMKRRYGIEQIETAIQEMNDPEGRYCPYCDKMRETYDDLCMECGTDT